MQNLLHELQTLLADQPRFMQEGRVIKQAVIDAAQSLDAELLQVLMSHESIKRHFFQEVAGVMVFDKVKLLRFVSNKAFLEDSYTAFKNKIGLVTKNADGLYDAYLSDTKEVVLAYPYKDCMLEGGQTKDDEKRSEIFWNETLAPDDIDRLKEPKAFTNIKRYTADAVTENVTNLSTEDNFIIKGNNLLALYSLLPVYRGKVKLIYIDPPYNTKSDSFLYNDSFNHSTWLTFMKDRLKVARELLCGGGVIFIQCDDNEQAYLKVLMDEIFGRENFVSNVIWRKRAGGGNDSKHMATEHENILFYAKNIVSLVTFGLSREKISHYKKDDKGYFSEKPLNDTALQDSIGLHYDIELPNGKILLGSEHQWKMTRKKFLDKLNNDSIIFKNDKVYYKHYIDIESNLIPSSIFYSVALNAEATKEMKDLFGEKVFSTPKPEKLIQKLIEITTQPNDLVLDFHLGSGTTAAVAHKMGRRYIGVEQMDYVEDIAVERLKKVIAGEQGGISKAMNWQGGGSFVYMELAKANQYFKDEIAAADNESDLLAIWERMQAEAFISYKVLPNVIEKNINDYEALSFEDKKRFMDLCLDKNMLYVPYCDMASKEFGLSEADQTATQSFYHLNNQTR